MGISNIVYIIEKIINQQIQKIESIQNVEEVKV